MANLDTAGVPQGDRKDNAIKISARARSKPLILAHQYERRFSLFEWHWPQGSELLFLPLAIPLAHLSLLSEIGGSCQAMATFAFV